MSQAHREYKEAIEAGHGAYLMDESEEKKDIFTVSVGNLPAGAAVLIKITYVTEVATSGPYISFVLPATVYPPSQDKALRDTTQGSVATVGVKDACGLSLEIGLDMPYPIAELYSSTHAINVKRTECVATVVLQEQNRPFEKEFVLSCLLSKPFEPRMTVEVSADGTYAGMVWVCARTRVCV